MSSRFCAAAVFLCLLSACAGGQQQAGTESILPPVEQTHITLEEKTIPEHCRVFSHLIISIPAGMSEADLSAALGQFGRKRGADYLLAGMARQSKNPADEVIFRSYGPEKPYSFKNRWLGWKFGFSDWNSGGPLVSYSLKQDSDSTAIFDVPADLQAVLLSCQLGPQRQ